MFLEEQPRWGAFKGDRSMDHEIKSVIGLVGECHCVGHQGPFFTKMHGGAGMRAVLFVSTQPPLQPSPEGPVHVSPG